MNATSNSTTKRETAAPQKPNLSRAGRRVRAGAFTAPADDLGQKQRDAAATLRNVATSLAAELDRELDDAFHMGQVVPVQVHELSGVDLVAALQPFLFRGSERAEKEVTLGRKA